MMFDAYMSIHSFASTSEPSSLDRRLEVAAHDHLTTLPLKISLYSVTNTRKQQQ